MDQYHCVASAGQLHQFILSCSFNPDLHMIFPIFTFLGYEDLIFAYDIHYDIYYTKALAGKADQLIPIIIQS